MCLLRSRNRAFEYWQFSFVWLSSYIATGVPTPSNPMSSSGDFPDIQDSITTKFVYLPLKFKTVYVAALLDSGSGIYVISLTLYNMLTVSV